MTRWILVPLLLLTACGSGPSTADPKALIEQFRSAMASQSSVRFEIERVVEGVHASRTTWSGVKCGLTSGGVLGSNVPREDPSSEVTRRSESRDGPRGYHVLQFGQDTYVSHTRLTMPAGKKYLKIDYLAQGALWQFDLDRDLKLDQFGVNPTDVFADLKRDTIRLVSSGGGRYEFASGRAVESNPMIAKDSEVRLTVWVDSDDRVTRAEQESRDGMGNLHRTTTVLTDWGAAPPPTRPAPETVATPTEVTYTR